jgi:uncharacterized membrane protein
MPSKYDTNPLDPDFPEKARAATAADDGQPTRVLGQGMAPTRKFPDVVPTEEQTRRFVDDPVPFAPAYHPPYAPMEHRGPYAPTPDKHRKVAGVNIQENILVAVPYIPWYIGLIAGALILLLVPKSEQKVRFHAAQGLAAHLGILIVTTILGIIANVTGFAAAGNVIFQILATVMLIIFTVKAWQGKPVHISSIEDMTNWLEEKISPKLAGK